MRRLPVLTDDAPDEMPEFSGTPHGEGRRLAVVASRFNEHVTRRLAEGFYKSRSPPLASLRR